jgi:lipoprotein-releasing system permease protein
MNIPWLIGLRFMGSHSTSGFLSLVARVSLLGLMLGVMALVIVVSVMNGFDTQLKHRILGAAPHGVLSDQPEVDPLVVQSAPFLRFEGMLLGSETRLISVFGIAPELEPEISVIADHMIQGELASLVEGDNQVIIGSALAARLGLWPGDTAIIMIPVASTGGNSVRPRIARVTVSGVFRLESEIDFGLALMNVNDLKMLTGAETVQYRVTLQDIFSLQDFEQRFGTTVLSTWADDYGDFFATVRMEKIMMFLLLTMIVAIAAFNTVSGLSMMIKEKQGEIAVLRTMGLAPLDITLVFIVQGSVVGIGGVVLGILLGLPVAYHVGEIVGFFENLFGGRMLAGTYFDRVPSDVRYGDILIIALVSMAIAVLATVYPSYRAGRLKPAEVLRAE